VCELTKKSRVISVALVAVLATGAVTVEKIISSRIATRVYEVLPRASDVTASIPLLDLPGNIISDSIKSIHINVGEYALKDSTLKPSLAIDARDISKATPNVIGSLDVTATIPADTITQLADFNNAQIVGNTLQVSVGSAGLGTAILVPKYSGNQIYFELQGVSLFGGEIPADSLPVDIKDQIKSKSVRTLNAPEGMSVKSISLSSQGLALTMQGKNIQSTNISSTF
jgi:hypothetical protein